MSTAYVIKDEDHILGIFSTKKKALKYIDTHGNMYNEIYEYPLDSYEDKDGDIFYVVVTERNGYENKFQFDKYENSDKYKKLNTFGTSTIKATIWPLNYNRRKWVFYIHCHGGKAAIMIVKKRMEYIKKNPSLFNGIYSVHERTTSIGSKFTDDYHQYNYITHEEIID